VNESALITAGPVMARANSEAATPAMVRLVVVDDQELIRAGLVALLRATPDIDVVGHATNGEQAVATAAATHPDVILMDIRLPGMDGIAATDRILETVAPPPKIIVLTTFDVNEYVYPALRAGASGFLLKETEPQRLINAIHTVAGGEMLFAPTVTRRLVEAYIDNNGPTVRQSPPAPTLDALTPRELEILRLVGTGLSNTEIANRLTVSAATVKTHLNRTMTKLDLSSRAQAVVAAYETGLVTPRQR
jgi:DNA-binding NarL/FixJ family response regulator